VDESSAPNWKQSDGPEDGAHGERKKAGVDDFFAEHGIPGASGKLPRHRGEKVSGFRKQGEYGAKKFIKP
jgi:hypothetical protein